MAQKSMGYVEMVWTCPNCQTKNRGSIRYCTSCGASQPKNVQFEKPMQETLITDERVIQQASAGPDRYCAYCGNRNPGDAQTCRACGADLGEGETRQAGTVFESTPQPTQATVKCAVCGTENTVDRIKCIGCGSPLDTTVKAVAPEPKAPARGGNKGCLILLLIFAVIVGVLVYMFTKTSDQTGVVSEKKWVSSVEILALVKRNGSDWRDRLPAGASDVRCSRRERSTSSSYVPGAEERCSAPYLVDKGNGYSEQVQDCTYIIYDDYCDYTYRDWGVVDRPTATGSLEEPYLPNITLGIGQRRGNESITYSVKFLSEEGKRYELVPSTYAEYASFPMNATYVLSVNMFDMVTDYRAK